jgi:hypothetical protein
MNDWTPQGTQAIDRNLYAAFIAFVKTSIEELQAKGHSVEFAGIIYLAGENDMAYGPYRKNAAKWLQATVTQSRKDLASPSLKWFVSQQPIYEDKEGPPNDFLQGLKEMATHDSNFIYLRSDDLPPQKERLVITTEGIVKLGEQLARGCLETQ